MENSGNFINCSKHKKNYLVDRFELDVIESRDETGKDKAKRKMHLNRIHRKYISFTIDCNIIKNRLNYILNRTKYK